MKSSIRHRLPILEIHVFRRILLPSLALILILLGVLALERVLRLVQMVTDSGLPAYEALGLVVYLLPHYLSLAVPAGFFIGTLIALRSLHDHSEIVVMRTSGVTMRRMQRPVLALAFLWCAVMAVMSGFIQPHARYRFRERVTEVVTGDIFAGLQGGVFHKVGNDITVRVNRIHPDGMTFDGFFISLEEAPGKRIILTAETGRRISQENVSPDAAAELRLSHGTFLRERDGENGKTITFQMEFEEAPLAIPMETVVKHFGPRGRDERELTGPELLAGGIPGLPAKTTPAELKTELHARIVEVFSLPVLALLATPLALIGQGRGARAWGLAIGVVAFIAYEKLTGLGEVMAADGRISPWVGLWIPWAGLVLVTTLLFHHYSGDHGRSVFDAIASIRPKTVNLKKSPDNSGAP
jgi:lipopolysaccharide export system permease protein